MVVLSWGIHSPVVIENGIAFLVDGYKHKGRVEVLYDEGWDLFTVRIINYDGSVKVQEDGIYIDGLISVLDNLIEKTFDYKERVRKQYYV